MPQIVPPGWAQEGNALTRTIARADFVEALALVLEIGRVAEAANHHPDIDIRYRTVSLSLSTHDAGHTVTEKDFALAQEINDLSEERIRLITDELRLRFHA
jgi:4a-hydroxytetrahydrobiopterin dehydratase